MRWRGLGVWYLAGIWLGLWLSWAAWANGWPSPADQERFLRQNKVPLAFWNLPVEQQVQALALEAFYARRYHWDGTIEDVASKQSMDKIDRIKMARYLAQRLQAPFYDPHSSLYRQALVTLENFTIEEETHPILILATNPSLPPTAQGPIAQFLAEIEAKFGDRVKVGVDAYGILQDGCSAYYCPALDGGQLYPTKDAAGWVNLGLRAMGQMFSAEKAADIWANQNVAHEFLHVRTTLRKLAGGYNFLMGDIMAVDYEAGEQHHYRGRFSLDEVAAYLTNIQQHLFVLHQTLTTRHRPFLSFIGPMVQKVWEKYFPQPLAARFTGPDVERRRINYSFAAILDFLELGAVVTATALQDLRQLVPDASTYPWARFWQDPPSPRNASAESLAETEAAAKARAGAELAEESSFSSSSKVIHPPPYQPYLQGMMVMVDVEHRFQHALRKLPWWRSPTPQTFAYFVPYSVLREIHHPALGGVSAAEQVAKYNFMNPLAVVREKTKLPDFNAATQAQLRRPIYNEEAFNDVLAYLAAQSAHLAQIRKLLRPLARRWFFYGQGILPLTSPALVKMEQDLAEVMQKIAAVEQSLPGGQEVAVMRVCAAQLVP